MPPKLYEHERHPLDIIAEQDAKSNKPVSETKTPVSRSEEELQFKISTFPNNLSYNVLCYEVALHLGRPFMYYNNKEKRNVGWPTTQAEMIAFLEEKGMKE